MTKARKYVIIKNRRSSLGVVRSNPEFGYKEFLILISAAVFCLTKTEKCHIIRVAGWLQFGGVGRDGISMLFFGYCASGRKIAVIVEVERQG